MHQLELPIDTHCRHCGVELEPYETVDIYTSTYCGNGVTARALCCKHYDGHGNLIDADVMHARRHPKKEG